MTDPRHLFEPLPDRRFGVIYADPPWDYGGRRQYDSNRLGGTEESGGADVHYPTVTLDDLRRLDVASIAAPDALLFMWATSPLLDQALDLLTAWGFGYTTVGFVWDKRRTNPGSYTMSRCELCLIGKRGRIPQPRGARNVRQLVTAKRGQHSAKPDEVRRRIVEMFPNHDRIELFARAVLPGWDNWPRVRVETAEHDPARSGSDCELIGQLPLLSTGRD
jgi:N6-adenosine-specific RNA methylase IME4